MSRVKDAVACPKFSVEYLECNTITSQIREDQTVLQECIAAAFTVIAVESESAPSELDELDFVLDRPFLFVVSSRDNLPLFAGVVNQP